MLDQTFFYRLQGKMKRNFHETLKNALGSLSSLLFPTVCVFCGADVGASVSGICAECSSNIRPVENPVCKTCGQPTAGLSAGSSMECGYCLGNKLHFEKARFAVIYTRVIRHGILHFKFYNSLYLGEVFSGFLSSAFRQHFQRQELDAIIPVPVHRKRLTQRGYNQCAILAKKLGTDVSLPVLTGALVKTRNTVPQTQLKRKQRLNNIKGSFTVPNPQEIAGKRILILDDVFTTGSTVSEASRILKRHGAQSVQALVLALRHGPIERGEETNLKAYSDMFFIDAN